MLHIKETSVPVDESLIDSRIRALANPSTLEKSLLERTVVLLKSTDKVVYRSLQENFLYYVVGDLHGDFDTLVRLLFTIYAARDPESVFILFLGDYIDRGKKSAEVLSTLVALFHLFPGRITLQKGNHERFFYQSGCISPESYPSDYYSIFIRNGETERNAKSLFIDFFGALPICTILETTRNEKILLTHAGFPDTRVLKKVHSLEQALEYGDPFCTQMKLPYTPESNFLWRDPSDERTTEQGPRYAYTLEDFRVLRKRFGIVRVIRSHEYHTTGRRGKDRGYKTHFKQAQDSVLTIFSTGGTSPDTAYPNVENPVFAKIEPNGEIQVMVLRDK